MKNILILTIMSAIIVGVSGLILLSQPEPAPGIIDMDESIRIFQSNVKYIDDNTNFTVTERGYYAVMDLANGDVKRAVEIINDPGYPEKFYDETGYLP